MTRFKDRIVFVAGAFALSAWFYLTFVDDLSIRWAYYGFVYRNTGADGVLLAFALALLPSLWAPNTSERPSASISLSIYFIVYIPSMFCVALISPSTESALPLLLTLLAGMSLVGASYRIRLPARSIRHRRGRRIPYKVFMLCIWAVSGTLLLYVAYSYRRSLVLPTLDTMYDVRLSARLVQDNSPIGRYFTGWLSRLLLPLLLTVSLWKRQYVALVPIALGYLLLFSATAHKAYFVVPTMVAGMHFLLRLARPRLGNALLYALLGVLVLITVVGLPAIRDLFLVRSMGWSGLATYLYDDFIKSHPVTWWSHVKGISVLVSNPYSDSIPLLIGYEYFHNPELTGNAHFWAMDGLMAAGYAGVLVISVAFAFLMRIVDRAAGSVVPSVAIPWMAAYATSFADAGLFSALLTGGLAFAVILFRFLPEEMYVPAQVEPRAEPARESSGAAQGTARVAPR